MCGKQITRTELLQYRVILFRGGYVYGKNRKTDKNLQFARGFARPMKVPSTLGNRFLVGVEKVRLLIC